MDSHRPPALRRVATRRTVWCILGILALGLAGCASDDAGRSPSSETSSPDTVVTGADGSGLLVVQLAGSAVVSDVDGNPVLELREVDPAAIVFADRPARLVRSKPTSAIAAEIAASDDPPNAALVWDEGGTERSVVVELSEGDYDEQTSTLRYRVRPLGPGESEMEGFDGGADLPDQPVTAVSLYIDNLLDDAVDAVTRRQCEVNFVNNTSTDLRLGDVTVENLTAIVTAPVSLEGHESYPIWDSTDSMADQKEAEAETGSDVIWVTYTGGNWDPSRPDLNILAAGDTTGTYVIANEVPRGCGGSIVIDNPASTPSNPLPPIATYHYHNPYLLTDSHSVDCADGFVCTITNHDFHNTLSDTVSICDGDVCP